MRKPQVTCHTSGNWQCSTDDHPFLHCNSSKDLIAALTPIALKELDAFLEHTQSTFMMMQNLSSTHPIRALLPCIHLCMRSWMNSLSRRSYYQSQQPTDWVSSLAYSLKANGKLQVCLDLKDLNAAIFSMTTTIPQPWMRPIMSSVVVCMLHEIGWHILLPMCCP